MRTCRSSPTVARRSAPFLGRVLDHYRTTTVAVGTMGLVTLATVSTGLVRLDPCVHFSDHDAVSVPFLASAEGVVEMPKLGAGTLAARS